MRRKSFRVKNPKPMKLEQKRISCMKWHWKIKILKAKLAIKDFCNFTTEKEQISSDITGGSGGNGYICASFKSIKKVI